MKITVIGGGSTYTPELVEEKFSTSGVLFPISIQSNITFSQIFLLTYSFYHHKEFLIHF